MSMHVPDHMVDVRYSSRIATLFFFFLILSDSLTLSILTLLRSVPDKYGIAMVYGEIVDLVRHFHLEPIATARF